MADPRDPRPRPPFAVHEYFLETAFEVRFQGLLRHAWQERSWHVIAAVPGSGTSLGIADFVFQAGPSKDALGTTRLPVSAIRAPKSGGKELALGMALSMAFGLVPTMAWYVRRAWLVRAMAEAGSNVSSSTMRRILTWPIWPFSRN